MLNRYIRNHMFIYVYRIYTSIYEKNHIWTFEYRYKDIYIWRYNIYIFIYMSIDKHTCNKERDIFSAGKDLR